MSPAGALRISRASLGGGVSPTGEVRGAIFFERLVSDGLLGSVR